MDLPYPNQPDLELLLSGILRKAKAADCYLVVKRVDDDGYVIENSSKTRVVALGIINILNENKKEEEVIGAFTIDVKKYKWAEAEGFTHDQMIDDLTEEVFNLIGVDEVFDFLCNE